MPKTTTTVKIPLRFRVPAYAVSLVTAGGGTPALTYLAAEHVVDTPTLVFLGALIAGIHVLADVLALSHLSLPDDDSTAAVPVTVTVDSGPVAATAKAVAPAAKKGAAK